MTCVQPASEHSKLSPTALVIDDRATGRRAHRQALEALGWQVLAASTLTEAASHAQAEPLLVVTDLNLSAEEYGAATAYRVQDLFPTAEVHIVTASTDEPMTLAELQAAGFAVHATGELGWMPRAPRMGELRGDGWLAHLDNPATRATVLGLVGVVIALGWGEVQEIRARQNMMESWFHDEQLRTREAISRFREENSRELGAIRESLARISTTMDRRSGVPVP
jgi:CheY-like chemotaxis protein